MLDVAKGGESMDSRQKLSDARAKVQKLLSSSAADKESQTSGQRMDVVKLDVARILVKSLLGKKTS